mgnify:CR=1 FL=1
MYLSKFFLDPANRQVQSELANRYELHRTLTAQFPNKNRKEVGLLYRIEIPERHFYQPITLLIQTQIKPDWSRFSQTGMLVELPQVKEFTPIFSEGETYRFRLLANPTVRRKQEDGKRKRVGLYTAKEQQDWIQRKANLGGFTIKAVKLMDLGMIESIKRQKNHTYHIKHLGIQFDGILQVSNGEGFKKSLVIGIGSAKAFGFGLLSLA